MGEAFTIVGLGEVLWDLFEDGKVLGGAPFNTACHAATLGHEGVPLSRVGEDRLGDEALGAAESLGVPTGLIQRDADHPTGTVNVSLDGAGVPRFAIVEDVAWDHMEADGAWLAAAARSHAVCFGTLAQRSPMSRRAVQQVLAAAERALIVCDANLRAPFYSREVIAESLAAADVLKLNDGEAAELQRILRRGPPDPPDVFLRAVMRDYGLVLACVTLGADGCRLLAPGEAVSRPAPRTAVVDTVGAGDAFTAGLVVKRLEGRPLASIADAANLLGAYVAGQRGATPRLSPAALDAFRAL